MSGTDELFPGAAEHGASTVSAGAAAAAQRRRGPGFAALAVAMVATAANISAALTAVATVIGQLGATGDSAANIDWVPTFEVIALAAAGILGLTALVLGIRAAQLRRSRGFGIAGGILGALAVFVDLAIAVVALAAVLSVGA